MKKKFIFTYWNRSSPWRASFFKFLSDKKYWIFILFSAYCLADLTLISLRPFFLFNETPLKLLPNEQSQKEVSATEYTPIWDFNVFHNATIPPSLSSNEEDSGQNQLPQLSRLPIQLNGTIVYNNPIYSIANITVKNKNTSESRHIGEDVDSLARITQITPERVYFINLNNNQEEYIEVQNMRNISFDLENRRKEETKGKDNSSIIKKIGDFQFQVKRSDINKHKDSLSKTLQEAKVVPHWEKGKMIGWRFRYIKSGSIYEQLGFKVSDIITSVAGELPRSQIQAAEMFQRFQHNTKLDIMIKRKGKDIAFSWLVDEDDASRNPPEGGTVF